ncbi:MAG: CaiB/BaiF CoA-transferase family protein [Gammaproteobacteria bacterium]|nr:carnitine dehydratase [Gammaproteobacteria bacterium]MBQ09403.1 carnitine dehydratase [Gammaproteobacteria bacterium]MDP6146389.1 CaiB/BaiF CoA-transferase family protein [Gammaproteobacteria bacterium]HJL80124.1 CaiB/BaiF CoA-transferase family protein [Gammaproteobacteria bacterium]HJM08805.1 CaiB/BaiF CoA-transferase family protein [Gammaproteobacteria bacterium]
MTSVKKERPLDGMRVIEMGQLIAGPFTGSMLGYFGAEVIKIEPPTGDPVRYWRLTENNTSYWWHSVSRNKKSITLNLKTDEGRQIAKDLILKSDVLIENFKPGTLEKWGMSPEELKKDNPGLITARISGYGQTGPRSHLPGYASVCEGFGGFRYVNGFEDRPPVRPNLSIGDTLAGLHAAMGVMLAYIQREKDPEKKGQVVDAAIYESVFQLMEAVVPEYSGCGAVREPSGSTITGIVPTNTYVTSDNKHVIIGGNGDSIFKRLMTAIGRPDMADDPRYENNQGRVVHEKVLDAAIEEWTRKHTSEEVLSTMDEVSVPAGPIYSVEDMVNDEHYIARGMFHEVEANGRTLQIPAMLPVLTETPGTTDWPGPELSEHTSEILEEMLGKTAEEIERFKSEGVV